MTNRKKEELPMEVEWEGVKAAHFQAFADKYGVPLESVRLEVELTPTYYNEVDKHFVLYSDHKK
jgi:hypothetical protein